MRIDRRGLRTLDGWLSEAQWRSAAAHLRRDSSQYKGKQRRDASGRRKAVAARCLLRVEHRGRRMGLYLARTLDVSPRGLCVLQGVGINPWSRVTVVLELANGASRVAGGVVAWCRPVKLDSGVVYGLGIELEVGSADAAL